MQDTSLFSVQELISFQLKLYGSISPEIAKAVVAELKHQRDFLKLIASENYSSLACQAAMGNWLTDKYAEGISGKRFYAGCEQVDIIESHTSNLAKRLFNAEYAYVQAHSGADANLIAYWAILNTCIEAPFLKQLGTSDLLSLSDEQWAELRHKLGNQRILGPHIFSGGHLTHGYRYNASGRMFEAHHYHVNPASGLFDYDEIEKQALEIRPLILIGGYSAYPHSLNFKRMREIADKVGAILMVDMSHFAGLVAGKVFQGDADPVAHADVVTSTTHKTLRGPRGGLILAKKRFAAGIDKGCPLVIGGPLPHVMAAKAIAFQEALEPGFAQYAQQIVVNSAALSKALLQRGVKMVGGVSQNHLVLFDVRPWGISGRQAELALRVCGFTVNRNTMPDDTYGAWYTSGLRLGTAAVTTLGMREAEMEILAENIVKVLENIKPLLIEKGDKKGQLSLNKYQLPENIVTEVQAKVKELLSRFPVYPEIDLPALERLVENL